MEAKKKEDAKWKDEVSEAVAKERRDAERAKREAVEAKQEARDLLAAEEKELAKTAAKGKGAKKKKGAQRMALMGFLSKQVAGQTEEEENKEEVKGETPDEGIEGVAPNLNRERGVIEAETIASDDKHPEKRMKAAFEAFKEAEMPRMREDMPGLKLSQYKERLWKKWQKHPDNPHNQM